MKSVGSSEELAEIPFVPKGIGVCGSPICNELESTLGDPFDGVVMVVSADGRGGVVIHLMKQIAKLGPDAIQSHCCEGGRYTCRWWG